MKMVKSLLLGSAAGLVAVAGAQAADLPVKAKPVQYVKICSLYGAGFYYVPGTDMCIKIGGWVRWETAWNNNGTSTNSVSSGFRDNRFTDRVWWRSRGYITADARDQTAYGTVRGYLAVGFSGNNAVTFDANRAFIQWAGFTFGLAQSFYDFYSSAAVGYHGWVPSEDTGDSGNEVAAYTFQFGNGWSSTIAAEFGGGANAIDRTTIINSNLGSGAIVGGAAVSSYGGLKAPDIVGNMRVDQAWGSAQIMGILHDVNATYYSSSVTTGLELSGGPSDKWGFVVGAGLKLNAPMIGHGDYFQGEVNYTQGDVRRLAVSAGGGNYFIQSGTSSAALGVLTDAVFGGSVAAGTATDLDLTTGWSVNASYEHFWNPAWKTSLYGSFMAFSFNDQANANLCGLEGFAAAGAPGSTAVALAGCSNNWNFWTIGSRTQWNVTKDFYMGVDVAYGKLHGMQTPAGIFPALALPSNTNTAVVRTASDQDILSVRFRIHRDFYP